jgi:hypothetical protein
MTFRDDLRSWASDTDALAPTEALVIKVYRCAMAGFSVGQTDCWDVGWRALGEAVSPADAGALFGEFYGFVRALLAVAPKSLAWRPASCRGLCNDEWLALSMIEAAQRSDMVGLLAAAAKLLAVDELGDALQSTQSLASALARRGLFLCSTRQDETCGSDLCPLRRLH